MSDPIPCARCGDPIRPGRGDICGCPMKPRPHVDGDAQYIGRSVVCDDASAIVVDSEWVDCRMIYLLETIDGKATQWVSRDRFRFSGTGRARASASRPRSDKEIVEKTVELTRKFASMGGFNFNDDKPYKSTNPRILGWWKQACVAQEILTNTDPYDAVANLED